MPHGFHENFRHFPDVMFRVANSCFTKHRVYNNSINFERN